MRALILHDGSADDEEIRVARACMHSIGIRPELQKPGNLSASALAALSATYAFLYMPAIPNGGNAYEDILEESGLSVPVIVTNMDGGAPDVENTGITGGRSGVATRRCVASYSSSTYTTSHGRTWAPSLSADGVAIERIAEEDSFGSAESEAGNLACWADTLSASGQRLYCSGNYSNILPFSFYAMVQQAITDGVVASLPRRAPLMVDLDHINGAFTHRSLELIDFLRTMIGNGMTWGGQQNANDGVFENMSSAVAEKLESMIADGSLAMCYHSHRSSGTEQPNTGTWPNLSDQITEAQEKSIYEADRAIAVGHGLQYGHRDSVDTEWHYNAGANNWREYTLALFSRDTSLAADPDNASSTQGKGAVSFRMGGSLNSTRIHGDESTCYHNAHHGYRRMIRGIELYVTKDLSNSSELPRSSQNDWRTLMGYIGRAIACAQVLYLHDEDLELAEQGPGEASKQDGREIAQIMRDIGNACPDVIEPWADPARLTAPRPAHSL